MSSIDRWYKKLWTARGARFNAYRRVKAIDKWSSAAIWMLSVYVIALNLIVFIPSSNEEDFSIHITIANITLSVFILGLSLFVAGEDYKVEYHNHHELGKALGPLYSKVSLAKDDQNTEVSLAEISKSYDEIIMRSSYNHYPIDYKYFKLQNRKDFGLRRWEYPFIWFSYRVVPISMYLILIVAPMVILVFLVIKIL